MADSDCIANDPVRFDADAGGQAYGLSLPSSSRTAVWLRVGGGSHDEPSHYPGLAHFLEHLLFLGGSGTTPDDGLMAFVAGQGGTVNASTRGRYTDFMLQVPRSALDGALWRLADMLARPRLDIDDQRREREVLEAEFIARGQDAGQRRDAALGAMLDGEHSLGRFVAGCRATLPVESDDFQQALRAYHTRFYHREGVELALAGALGDAERALVETFFDALPQVSAEARQTLEPALAWRHPAMHLHAGGPAVLTLAVPLEPLPSEAGERLACLCHWVTSPLEGGLLQRLSARGVQSVDARIVYRQGPQALVAIDIEQGQGEGASREAILAAVRGWLIAHADDRGAWSTYRASVRRRQPLMSPLDRLRQWFDQRAEPGQDGEGWPILLSRAADRMGLLSSDARPCPPWPEAGFPLQLQVDPAPPAMTSEEVNQWAWPLAPFNSWLAPQPIKAATVVVPEAMRVLPFSLPDGLGTLFLDWRGGRSLSLPSPVEQPAIERIRWQAAQAGVDVRLTLHPRVWQVSLEGHAEILTDVLRALAEPLAAMARAREALPRRAPAGDVMPIRGLLAEWQTRVFDAMTSAAVDEPLLWRGLSAGVPALGDALERLPGRPAPSPASLYVARIGRNWLTAEVPGDSAVLLFCPQAGADALDEVAWRLLASLYERPFYHALRITQQLGYAVFSGYRQAFGMGGVLFGVQSPSADAPQLVEAIERFLRAQTVTLASLSGNAFSALRQGMAERLTLPDDEWRQRMEVEWQGLLGGAPTDRLDQLREALARLTPDALLARHLALVDATHGWWVLSNAAPPSHGWQSE